MGMARARPWSDDAECWCRSGLGLSRVASLSTGGIMALVLLCLIVQNGLHR